MTKRGRERDTEEEEELEKDTVGDMENAPIEPCATPLGRWRDLDRLLLRPGPLAGPDFEPGPEVYNLDLPWCHNFVGRLWTLTSSADSCADDGDFAAALQNFSCRSRRLRL